jgi:DNA-binding transcriptional regulator YdaS (Cro superfamily)
MMMTRPHQRKTERTAPDAAIEAAGGARALGRALGINYTAILRWGAVPPLRVLQIERLTGVSRHELRPDIYPRE